MPLELKCNDTLVLCQTWEWLCGQELHLGAHTEGSPSRTGQVEGLAQYKASERDLKGSVGVR